jgi:hypothetical protein
LLYGKGNRKSLHANHVQLLISIYHLNSGLGEI